MTIHRTFATGQSAGFRIPADVNYAEARVNGVPTPVTTVAGFVLMQFTPAVAAVVDIEYDDPTAPDVTFFAPLVCNTFLPVGQGSATFTRATTATVEDQDGVLRTALSGEVRFTGARRVRNLAVADVTYSGCLLGSGTTLSSSTAVAPDGTNTAGVFALPTAGTSYVAPPVGGNGAAFVESVWLKGDVAGTVDFMDPSSGLFAVPVSITTQWARYAIPPQTSPTNVWMGLRRAAGSPISSLSLWHPQKEEVAGQSNTNPSEYVSVGVLSSPHHGSHVDGVKCFRHLNGNTVASNVVTEARGADIAAGTLKKYLPEGARTNLCLPSEDFATTWVNGNSTETVNAAVAPDGNTTADKLQEDATAGVQHNISLTAFAGTSGIPQTISVFAKAAERNWFAIRSSDSVDRYAYFDLAGGVLGSTVGMTSSAIVAYPNGWYRCSATFTPGLNTAPIFFVTTGDSTTVSNGVLGSGLYLWGAQQEAASFASTYIPTTTVAVTRNADALTYPSAGNYSANAGSAFAELSLNSGAAGVQRRALRVGDTGRMFGVPASQATTAIYMFDGTNEPCKTGLTDMATGVRKRACSWGAAGLAITGDGAAVATSAFDGVFGDGTLIEVSTIVEDWFGNIGMIRISSYQVPDALLQELTRNPT